MPHVRDSLFTGGVSSSAVQILADARREHPAEFAAGEKAQVDAAISKPVEELRRVVSEWAQTIDEQLADRAEILRDRRRLNVCPTPTRMVRVEGELDPEGGEAVLTALQAKVDAELRAGGGRDLRTPAQRRATPCASWPHRYLDSSERPTVGGERPHVTVTVYVQTLRNGHTGGRDCAGSGRCEPDHVGAVSPATARRLACDASVLPVVLGGPPSPWTWDDEPRWSRRACAGRWCSGTSGAGSLPAPSPFLVRRPPHRALGRRGADRPAQHGAAVPSPSQTGAPGGISPAAGRRQAGVQTARWLGDRGREGSAVATPCRTGRSCGQSVRTLPCCVGFAECDLERLDRSLGVVFADHQRRGETEHVAVQASLADQEAGLLARFHP